MFFAGDSFSLRTKVTCVIVNRILEKLPLCDIQDVFHEDAKRRTIVKQANKVKELGSKRKTEPRWLDKTEIQGNSYKTLDSSAQGRSRSPQMIEEKFENNELVEFTT